MEHLALEIFDLTGTGSKYATMPEDASITITDTSEIFASGDVWSYSFTLNVLANAHIFGTSGDIHGTRLHEQVDRRRARLWVEGLPLYLGYLRLDDEVEVDEEGNIDVSFESGQKTFEEMISGAKANQVPMMGDVRIGVALWRKRKVKCWMHLTAAAVFDDGSTSESADVLRNNTAHGHGGETVMFDYDGEDENNAVQQYPRMVFPKGEFRRITDSDSSDVYASSHGNFGGQSSEHQVETESVDCLNTDYPYDDSHPYCNIALCYQRYGYEKKNERGEVVPDYSGEPEAQRGYEVMPANRVNSAPNFFVIYWIRALMKHLGIYIEENQMTDVEDLRRLFFVNTNCAYREPEIIRGSEHDEGYNRYLFPSGPSRLAVPRLVAEQVDQEKLIKVSECSFAVTADTVIGDPIYDASNVNPSVVNLSAKIPTIDHLTVSIKSVDPLTASDVNDYKRANSYLHDAFATSECFPNAEISEVISAIESGFGVRFLFSDNYQRVRIVLLRNIFRSEETQEIKCEVVSDSRQENCIRGFRMTYGDSEDTAFYYKGFADMLPHIKDLWPDTSDKHDYSHWDLNADYASIMQKVSAFDKTCYVTPATGNAYGIKIDKDAKRYEELHPSLFEYAGYMDAEDGDCTGEEETIETVTVGFAPAVMNDVNMEEERDKRVRTQRFALFVDETMRPRRPDLKDLPSDEQPGVKSYNDSDALYDVDRMYEKYGGSGTETNMTSDGVVKPGEFAITSDMFASASGLQTVIKHTIKPFELGFEVGEQESIEIRWNVSLGIDGHINEGYRLYLQDNFEPNDDGVSPVETHDWGVTLGIMRGSGSDAYVDYKADDRDGEGNDTWEIVPGSNATAHADTCDDYGAEFDYTGSQRVTAAGAAAKLEELFPDSDAPFNDPTLGYITGTTWIYSYDAEGRRHAVLIATEYSEAGVTVTGSGDIRYFVTLTLEELLALSSTSRHMVIETDSSTERGNTLLQLCRLAYGGSTEEMVIDDGVGSRYGRFSLKLRAEKPNPYFDPSRYEGSLNRRYLPVSDENLRGRGLIDQFYKEYSYWVRNARIIKRTVQMTLAQLLAIDKTKKTVVGDITGFVRKLQYTVSNKTGLGMVTMEIMYI